MKSLEQLLIRINLLDEEQINEDVRWDVIDTLNSVVDNKEEENKTEALTQIHNTLDNAIKRLEELIKK